jgi:hypothetical protein
VELWILRSAASKPDRGSSDPNDSVARIILWRNHCALPVLFSFLFVYGKGVTDVFDLEVTLIVTVGVDELARDASLRFRTWRLRRSGGEISFSSIMELREEILGVCMLEEEEGQASSSIDMGGSRSQLVAKVGSSRPAALNMAWKWVRFSGFIAWLLCVRN